MNKWNKSELVSCLY